MDTTRRLGIDQTVPEEHAANQPLVQVAVDGSAGSGRALEWALQEAALRLCAVELVTAYQPEHGESAKDARQQAERTQHSTMDKFMPGRHAQVSWQVVQRDPSTYWCAARRAAQCS